MLMSEMKIVAIARQSSLIVEVFRKPEVPSHSIEKRFICRKMKHNTGIITIDFNKNAKITF